MTTSFSTVNYLSDHLVDVSEYKFERVPTFWVIYLCVLKAIRPLYNGFAGYGDYIHGDLNILVINTNLSTLRKFVKMVKV